MFLFVFSPNQEVLSQHREDWSDRAPECFLFVFSPNPEVLSRHRGDWSYDHRRHELQETLGKVHEERGSMYNLYNVAPYTILTCHVPKSVS